VDGPNQVSCELHTFSDASEHACAAAVYLRVEYKGGHIFIRLVMAKTKLAPRRTISVAKLELQAELLGVRVCSHVESALGRPVTRRVFGTDSSCTRNWARSTSAYYKGHSS
jgi:Pao retrotransposon peptidase